MLKSSISINCYVDSQNNIIGTCMYEMYQEILLDIDLYCTYSYTFTIPYTQKEPKNLIEKDF